MAPLYEVESEPEVRSWLADLSDRDFGRVDFLTGLLAEHAHDLGEPYTHHLAERSRSCGSTCCASRPGSPTRWPLGRRVILLTVFRKTRGAETTEVARALRAQVIVKPSTARPTKYSTGR